MSVADYVVLASYVTLLLEIGLFPIASEASVVQLVGRRTESRAPAMMAARAAPLPTRLLRYLLPTALCVSLFVLPILVVLWPASRTVLAPWSAPWLVAPGIAAVVLGRALTFGSVLQLRAAKRRDALPAGCFRHSRNPGLVGMFLMYAGLCAAVGGPWLWLGAPLYFLNMHVRVRLEEAELSARFASSWQDYERAVPRYLPLPGLR